MGANGGGPVVNILAAGTFQQREQPPFQFFYGQITVIKGALQSGADLLPPAGQTGVNTGKRFFQRSHIGTALINDFCPGTSQVTVPNKQGVGAHFTCRNISQQHISLGQTAVVVAEQFFISCTNLAQSKI